MRMGDAARVRAAMHAICGDPERVALIEECMRTAACCGEGPEEATPVEVLQFFYSFYRATLRPLRSKEADRRNVYILVDLARFSLEEAARICAQPRATIALWHKEARGYECHLKLVAA